MRRAVLILALLLLAACNPPARAVSFFKAHPDVAATVLADCTAGTHRGAECENAKAGEAQIESDKRLSLYKQSFEANPGGSGHGQ
jgi:hypothetical protein